MEHQVTKSLFALLDQGDKILPKIQKKAVLFVGKTKGGKSTCMQWMMSRPLMGYSDEVEDEFSLVINYKNMQEGAEIKQGFGSGTLIPNIELVTTADKSKYSFIDMAGFGDSRDYKGIITVAYMLKAVLDSAQKVKFIIVCSASTIQDSNLGNAVQNFVEFVKMFDFKQLSLETRAAVYKSTTVIMTRTKQEYKMEAYCKRLKKMLEDYKKSKNDKHKDYVIELLSEITSKQKITIFNAAKLNQLAQPGTCPLAQRLQDQNWDYIQVQKIKKEHYQKVKRLHSSPFSMPMIPADQTDQIQKFVNDINTKVEMFDEFAGLITSFIIQATQDQRCYQTMVNYQQCFQRLSEFLKKHDNYDNYKGRACERLSKMNAYGFSNQIDPQKEKTQLCFGVQLMEKVKIIYQNTLYLDIALGISQKQAQKQQLQRVKLAILGTIKTLKEISCKNAKQQSNFVDLAYVMSRSCREVSMLRQIDPERILDPISISSKITSLHIRPLNQLFKSFLSEQTAEFKAIVSKNAILRKKMIQFGRQFKVNTPLNNGGSSGDIDLPPPIQIWLNRISLLNDDAKALIKQKKYAQAIDMIINLLDQIRDYEQQQVTSQRQLGDIGDIVDENPGEQLFIEAYETLASCFEKINDTRAIETARNIYQLISFIQPASACWEKLIQISETKEQKYRFCIDYADFLQKCIQTSKAVKYLHEAFRYAYDKYSRAEIRAKLEKTYMDYQLMLEDNGNWRKFSYVKYDESMIDQIRYVRSELEKDAKI